MLRLIHVACFVSVLGLVALPWSAHGQDGDASPPTATDEAQLDISETQTQAPPGECQCPVCECPRPANVSETIDTTRNLVHSAHRRALQAAEQRSSLEQTLKAEFVTEGTPLTERRESVNADSLPDKGVTTEQAWLFVPRVILYPVHVVTEYGVRWPLGQLFTAIEKYRIVEYTIEALTFADGKAGFVPLFSVGGSQTGSLGVNFFYNELADGHLDLDIGAQGFPGRNLETKSEILLRVPTERWRLIAAGGLDRRDDHFFFGVGTQEDVRESAKFQMWQYLARLCFEGGTSEDPAGGSLMAGFARRDIRCSPDLADDVCGADGTFSDDDLYDARLRDVEPLKRDHSVLQGELHLYYDSRPERPGPGTGVRVESFAGGALGVGSSTDLAALRYGGEISGFWDVFGAHQRTIGLRVRAEAVEPMSSSRDIPVAELVTLGGVEAMRGFREDRFRGRSSLVTTLDYRYPVWSFFDGELFFEVGELAGPGFRDFDAGRLRGVAGLGLRSIDLLGRHLSYDLNIAVGTAPFSTGFSVQEFRVNFGTNWGF